MSRVAEVGRELSDGSLRTGRSADGARGALQPTAGWGYRPCVLHAERADDENDRRTGLT